MEHLDGCADRRVAERDHADRRATGARLRRRDDHRAAERQATRAGGERLELAERGGDRARPAARDRLEYARDARSPAVVDHRATLGLTAHDLAREWIAAAPR